MENLYTNYKNIVDRAILAGIITEESRHFYLSAIQEEDDSELSELESRLNKEEIIDLNLKCKQRSERLDATTSVNDENKNRSKTIENNALNTNDCQSISEGTIENYSILDIKSPKRDFIEETDSDSCSDKQENMESMSTQKRESKVSTKIMKKPLKYQLVDFNAPIYVDIKRNKPKIKRHPSNNANSSRRDNLCANYYDNKNSKVSKTDNTQNLKKGMLPHSKMSSMEKSKRSILTKSFRDFNNSNLISDRIDFQDEENGYKYQVGKQTMKTKSVHTCSKSERNENSEFSKADLKIILNSHKLSRDKKLSQCDNENAIESNLNRFKVPVNRGYTYKIKQNNPVVSDGCQNTSIEKEYRVRDEEKTEKKKHCECNHSCLSTQYANDYAKPVSENENSELDITTEKNSAEKSCDRILKVNIFCQFYQDDDLKKPNDVQKHAGSQDGHGENMEHEVTDAIDHTEKEKNKGRKKMHRLSKIFSSIKMKKK